jgi:hypothetical protein
MNSTLRAILFGAVGAVIGWLAAAAATLVLGIIAGVLAVIEVRFLVALVVILSLVTPIIPTFVLTTTISVGTDKSNLSKKTIGIIAAILTAGLVSIPLVLITNDNFPNELMLTTLEQPDWVGAVMTGYVWLMVVLSPIIAFIIAADIPIGSAKPDRVEDRPQA